jgi:hypothetical protein
MPALTKQQLDAAQEFATASIAALKSANGIHPGTVVAGTARMAGTYLFRSGSATPPKDQPALSFVETQRLLEESYAPISARFGFSNTDAAYAVAAATSLLIGHCAKVLDPNVAFALAAYGFVEGTKTAPDPVVHPPANG